METLWLKNPTILLDPKKLKYYMPGSNQIWQEQANALVRFIIYLSLILYLYYKNPLVLIIPPLLMMGIQYYFYQEGKLSTWLSKTFNPLTTSEIFLSDSRESHLNISPPDLDISPPDLDISSPDLKKNVYPQDSNHPTKLIDQDCKKSTIDNPFGNAMPYDTIEKQVTPVCPNEFKKDEKFYSKLFAGVDDLFGRNNSQRQFTTNPSSTKINDREAAIQFFYNTPYSE